jgi:hypothetical protein
MDNSYTPQLPPGKYARDIRFPNGEIKTILSNKCSDADMLAWEEDKNKMLTRFKSLPTLEKAKMLTFLLKGKEDSWGKAIANFISRETGFIC